MTRYMIRMILTRGLLHLDWKDSRISPSFLKQIQSPLVCDSLLAVSASNIISTHLFHYIPTRIKLK